jgi:ribosomal protein L28
VAEAGGSQVSGKALSQKQNKTKRLMKPFKARQLIYYADY